MNELIKKSPKHRDTRKNLFQIAKKLASNKKIITGFSSSKETKKETIDELGLHRTYIVKTSNLSDSISHSICGGSSINPRIS